MKKFNIYFLLCVAIVLHSVAYAGIFGKDEKKINRLGDDISRYVFLETTFFKFDFVFNKCKVNIIEFKRKNGNKQNSFSRRGTKVATVDLGKLDEKSMISSDMRIKVFCSKYSENCIVDKNGKEIDSAYNDLGFMPARVFYIDIQTGRGDKVADMLKSLLKECKVSQTHSDKIRIINKKLLKASKDGSLYMVKEYISDGADVNAKNKYSNTPLLYAAYKDHFGIVKYLVSKGADVNAKSKGGWTPLMFAVDKGYFDIVKYLVSKGADVNAKNKYGNTHLMEAAYKGYFKIVMYLTAEGADVNAKDEDGYTPLLYSAFGDNENTDLVGFLLVIGADIHHKNKKGLTVINIAKNRKKTKIVKFLKTLLANPNTLGKFKAQNPNKKIYTLKDVNMEKLGKTGKAVDKKTNEPLTGILVTLYYTEKNGDGPIAMITNVKNGSPKGKGKTFSIEGKPK